jgi:hypothetical protein
MATAQDPGRGTLILILGILGIVCCGVLAPVAWILGKQDLTKIRSGEISTEAEQLTNIGMILGIVGTVLLCLQIVAGCVWGILVGLAGAGAAKGRTALDVIDALASAM